LLCLLLHLDALAAQESTLPGPTVPDGFGVNIHFTKFQPGELSDFKNAGFGLIRMDLGWGEIERSTGVYDFSAFDTLLSELDSAGARALLIFDYSNPLYDQGLSPYTPSGQAAFAKYAAAAASHFRGRHVIWEIYNEPNGGFWTPRVNVDDYAALVKSTVAAVRRVDPNAIILAGATSTFPTNYIQALLRSGALADVNALSVHPYRGNNPETAADDYSRTRILIARAALPGQKPLPIVCSEWGYSTVTGGGFSEQKQAAYMVREYLSNLACGVNLTIYYDWKNDGPDPANNEHRFGIQTQDLQPKPAYLAAQSLISALRGYTFRHRLDASESADYRLLFQGSKDLSLVTWSSKDNGDSPSLPIIQKIAPGAPQYNELLRIASIRFAPDTSKSGTVMARARVGNFLPMAAWPTAVSQPSGFNNIFYLDNKPDSSAIAAVAKTDSGAPAAVAVSFSYQSGKEWRYYTLAPTEPIAIPTGAKALSLWVRGDGNGITIRARFTDQTGQTFQPEGVAITWNGWQAVELPLDGINSSHWGGANDGVPHGRLQWNAIPLLDCGGMPEHTGTIELAAPQYVMP
jgi:hypothetical protein